MADVRVVVHGTQGSTAELNVGPPAARGATLNSRICLPEAAGDFWGLTLLFDSDNDGWGFSAIGAALDGGPSYTWGVPSGTWLKESVNTFSVSVGSLDSHTCGAGEVTVALELTTGAGTYDAGKRDVRVILHGDDGSTPELNVGWPAGRSGTLDLHLCLPAALGSFWALELRYDSADDGWTCAQVQATVDSNTAHTWSALPLLKGAANASPLLSRATAAGACMAGEEVLAVSINTGSGYWDPGYAPLYIFAFGRSSDVGASTEAAPPPPKGRARNHILCLPASAGGFWGLRMRYASGDGWTTRNGITAYLPASDTTLKWSRTMSFKQQAGDRTTAFLTRSNADGVCAGGRSVELTVATGQLWGSGSLAVTLTGSAGNGAQVDLGPPPGSGARLRHALCLPDAAGGLAGLQLSYTAVESGNWYPTSVAAMASDNLGWRETESVWRLRSSHAFTAATLSMASATLQLPSDAVKAGDHYYSFLAPDSGQLVGGKVAAVFPLFCICTHNARSIPFCALHFARYAPLADNTRSIPFCTLHFARSSPSVRHRHPRPTQRRGSPARPWAPGWPSSPTRRSSANLRLPPAAKAGSAPPASCPRPTGSGTTAPMCLLRPSGTSTRLVQERVSRRPETVPDRLSSALNPHSPQHGATQPTIPLPTHPSRAGSRPSAWSCGTTACGTTSCATTSAASVTASASMAPARRWAAAPTPTTAMRQSPTP